MKHFITERVAGMGLVFILSLFILFHTCILLNLIPADMVWGGRQRERSELFILELVSLAVTFMMVLVAAARAGLIRVRAGARTLTIAMWIMFGLFILNTLGNFTSVHPVEKYLFAPLT